jgi:hypothetical protein
VQRDRPPHPLERLLEIRELLALRSNREIEADGPVEQRLGLSADAMSPFAAKVRAALLIAINVRLL